MQKNKLLSSCLVAFATVVTLSCSNDFKDLNNPNAQQAIMQLAESYLTGGNCDAAINALQPLLVAPYLNYDVRMLEASAYGCKGGINFPNMIVAVKDAGSDVWSALVKSNFSTVTTKTDHLSALDQATAILGQTSDDGSLDARYRTADANMYMVFVQSNVIATVISPLGDANSANGHKQRVMNCAGTCSTSDKCHIQTAIALINDSLGYVSAGPAIDSVRTNITAACTAAFGSGSSCPTNKSVSNCMSNAGLQADGALLGAAIDSSWNF